MGLAFCLGWILARSEHPLFTVDQPWTHRGHIPFLGCRSALNEGCQQVLREATLDLAVVGM